MKKEEKNKGRKKHKNYVFEQLQLSKVDEAAKMITDGFLTSNSIWMKLNIPYEEAYEYNKFRLIQGYKKNWSFVKVFLLRLFPTQIQISWFFLGSTTTSMTTSTQTKLSPKNILGSMS